MVKREKIAPSFQVPDDIEIDILSRLSVKSLLRFKCVKKSWRNFIEDPVFIAMHLNYYGKSSTGFLLYGSRPYKYIKQYLNCSSIDVSMSIKILFGKSPGYMIGSTNGLVCLSNDLYFFLKEDKRLSIYICNPSTREILELPECHHAYNDFVLSIGFGFCPKFNDYKVVVVKLLDSVVNVRDPNCCLFSLGVEVYSLNRNSWRSTKIVNPRSVLTTSFQGKGYFNGAFHWGGRDLKSSKRMIMSFQFDEEVFQELNLPNHPDFQKENYFLNALIIEYQNFFSLIIKQKVNMHVYDLWVMKEYGVSDSWIKQLTIEVPILEDRLMFQPVMSFENNGELLVLRDWYGRTVWYNTKTKQIERSKEVLRGRSIRYKESLVSLSTKKVV
ncbi:hypothetical protein CXB51_015403 [Gossypium anomalum]|uniref:F-box domain-containing protein n=1 Tax=Gossypium anomalum TaxID=47600 RepID=A0A8J6CZI2_9ROSI|nr:hypothetical protein CXB51_015403 [Gossypium anomalum]